MIDKKIKDNNLFELYLNQNEKNSSEIEKIYIYHIFKDLD